MRTQRQYEPTTRARQAAEIDGRSWQVMGNVAKCSVPPGHRAPQEAQVVTPDPIKGGGWRIAWAFLGMLVAAFIASPWIAKLMGCAVLVLPLWVCR